MSPKQASGRSRKPSGRVTIVDVARAAGVSTGTVSHVLSNARRVRPETRARVEEAIERLGFQPDSVARAMILRRTQTIGMLIPDITNPFFADLSWSVEQALASVDHALVFGNSGNDPAREERYLRSFVTRRVDAIIVGVAGAQNLDLLRRIGGEIPTVLFDRVVDGAPWDSVLTNNDGGIAALVDHLVGLGHRHIAFANADPTLPTAAARRAAIVARLAVHGLELVAETNGAFTLASGREQGEQLLAHTPRPTAICAGNDLIAMGVISAAHAAGLSVPGDLSVTGYDDIAYAAHTAPPLTTVRQPADEIAERIVELLLARIAEPSSPPSQVSLEPSLCVRASTAAVSS
jgi:LacI family transcriptional regulator